MDSMHPNVEPVKPVGPPADPAYPAAAAPADIARWLRYLVAPGSVFELRAFPDSGPVLSGTFQESELADAAAIAAELSPTCSAVYFTLNPVRPERFVERTPRLQKGSAVADGDILERRWLLVDVDPVRPAGVSASPATPTSTPAPATW